MTSANKKGVRLGSGAARGAVRAGAAPYAWVRRGGGRGRATCLAGLGLLDLLG
ncbi:hypothetical protein [Streptomyces sp. NPDC057413]|uniref:hypothetical protein n=1 Tax=Streptomyces sp. NPDC057413 TaxID=3346124 RepID=UPI0036924AE7